MYESTRVTPCPALAAPIAMSAVLTIRRDPGLTVSRLPSADANVHERPWWMAENAIVSCASRSPGREGRPRFSRYAGEAQATRRTVPTRTAWSVESGSLAMRTPTSMPSSTRLTTREALALVQRADTFFPLRWSSPEQARELPPTGDWPEVDGALKNCEEFTGRREGGKTRMSWPEPNPKFRAPRLPASP
jgi:hypothetical protein